MKLSVTPGEIVFDSIDVDTTSEAKVVRLTNNHWNDAVLQSMEVVGPFQMNRDLCPDVIAPGAIAEISLTFVPTYVGAIKGALLIDAGELGNLYVPLSGESVGSVNVYEEAIQKLQEATDLNEETKGYRDEALSLRDDMVTAFLEGEHYTDPLYATALAAGIAGTVAGDKFAVSGEDVTYVSLYRNVDGVSANILFSLNTPDAAQATIDTLQAMSDDIIDRATAEADRAANLTEIANEATSLLDGTTIVYGVPSGVIPVGSAVTASEHNIFRRAIREDTLFKEVAFRANGTGDVIIGIYDQPVGGTRLRGYTIPAVADTDVETQIQLIAYAGEYLGVSGPGIIGYDQAQRADQGGYYHGNGQPTSQESLRTTSRRLMLRVVGGRLDRLDVVDRTTANITRTAAQVVGTVGDLPNSGLVLAHSQTWTIGDFAKQDGVWDNLDVICSVPTIIECRVCSVDGDTRTVVEEIKIPVIAGLNELTPNLPVRKGEELGFLTPVATIYHSSPGVTPMYNGGGASDESFTDATVVSTDPAFRATISFTELNVDPAVVPPRPTSVDLPFDNAIDFVGGQSNDEGSRTNSNGEPDITTEARDDNAAYPAWLGSSAPGEISPATVDNSERIGADGQDLEPRGEWSGLGFGVYLRELLERENNVSFETHESRLITVNCAKGGTAIANLMRTSKPYIYAIAAATNLKSLHPNAGASATGMAQGESDADSDTPIATYESLFIQRAEEFDEDIRAAMGQFRPVPTITWQCNSYNGANLVTTRRDIGLAHFKMAMEHPLIGWEGPAYAYSFYDFQHIDAASQRLRGARRARVVKDWLYDRKPKPLPLHIVSHSVEGNTVAAKWDRGGLVLDDNLVSPHILHGLLIEKPDGTNIATSVEIKSDGARDNMTVWSCSETPPVGSRIRIASRREALSQAFADARADAFNGYAANLRDSAGKIDIFDGVPLHNWVPACDVDLE